MIEENLTKTVGTYIRDILRADTSLLTTLGITVATAQNYIFFTRPIQQVEGFTNPRIVIEPAPSQSGKLAYTNIYQGQEIFLINIWVNNQPYDTILTILDRIIYLFNKKNYNFVSSGYNINFGEFECTGKLSYPDPDKEHTNKGEINIALNIGGI